MTLSYLLDLIPLYAAKTAAFRKDNPACHEITWTVENIDPNMVEQLARHHDDLWYRNGDHIAYCLHGEGYFIHFESWPVGNRGIVNRVSQP